MPARQSRFPLTLLFLAMIDWISLAVFECQSFTQRIQIGHQSSLCVLPCLIQMSEISPTSIGDTCADFAKIDSERHSGLQMEQRTYITMERVMKGRDNE